MYFKWVNCVNYTVTNYSCHQKRDRHTHVGRKIPTTMPQSSDPARHLRKRRQTTRRKELWRGWQWQMHTASVPETLPTKAVLEPDGCAGECCQTFKGEWTNSIRIHPETWKGHSPTRYEVNSTLTPKPHSTRARKLQNNILMNINVDLTKTNPTIH